ncbi:TetR/AcrR family transcriptional regulator C-terminal domain-containing protein [Mumia quercus]|uniref:TetR/AcrR family transcriptional regulator C-terminal domain-containing protein n=1 Tax=Mumia quercus TaxID=2976125 RepID=UPI0021D2448F|nr:TetR/AcrR family transcriptional regulator C-terminal domain-containing protein [Mumia quercus]
MARRPPLTREVVLRTAVALADESGATSLTMRALARELGIEAMSLYHHVANKDALLDGMVDLVFAEIDLPVAGRDWRTEIRRRCLSAREVLLRHPWAVGFVESRSSPGPATLRHHEAVLACLREGGLSVVLAAHAFALLDAQLFGQVLQETSLPFTESEGAAEVAESVLRETAPTELPYLTEIAVEHVMKPGYDFGDEYAYGLDLILDGLEQRRRAEEA